MVEAFKLPILGSRNQSNIYRKGKENLVFTLCAISHKYVCIFKSVITFFNALFFPVCVVLCQFFSAVLIFCQCSVSGFYQNVAVLSSNCLVSNSLSPSNIVTVLTKTAEEICCLSRFTLFLFVSLSSVLSLWAGFQSFPFLVQMRKSICERGNMFKLQ